MGQAKTACPFLFVKEGKVPRVTRGLADDHIYQIINRGNEVCSILVAIAPVK